MLQRAIAPKLKSTAQVQILADVEDEKFGSNTVKVMSYNLFGWNAFNANSWRKANVLQKITDWDPDVLGAQEVEMGGSQGYHEVKSDIMRTTGLEHIGGSQFFKSSALEKHETKDFSLAGGYWMSMTRFKHKKSGSYFLFFNSHWKHGHGMEQAETVANAIHAQREKYDSAPVVLVGDTNQFCDGHDSEAWRYLQGEVVGGKSSPVVFEDALANDKEKSFSDSNNPDCRVDLVFVTRGDWTVSESKIDREGMGAGGTASDHAPLMVELAFPCNSWWCR
jgi:endonuclease/exonuclease/phosphatase family metal-dependent hydrolase